MCIISGDDLSINCFINIAIVKTMFGTSQINTKIKSHREIIFFSMFVILNYIEVSVKMITNVLLRNNFNRTEK